MKNPPKHLVIVAAVLLAMVLLATACSQPAPAPAPVKETVIVKETVPPVEATVVVKETVIVQPTPRPTEPPQPEVREASPPVAILEIVPVSANSMDPNAITATLKYMTDTVVGEVSSTVWMVSTGLTNQPVSVPIHIAVRPADPQNTGKPTWTLTGPVGSTAAIMDPAAMSTEFTPDVIGIYKVDVTLTNDAGTSQMQSVQIHAGTFIGANVGNCQQCHPVKVAEWDQTRRSKTLTKLIDSNATPLSEPCLSCHTTGWYYPPANNGGWNDVQARLGYKWPTWAEIQAGGNWEKMPAELKNMANVQCEACHGPAKEHVATGTTIMAISMDEGVCNTCHNGGGPHQTGTDLQNAKHADKGAEAWSYPTGPDHQNCVRCHSGNGYVSFLRDPKNMSSWDNTPHTLVCASCHDPHSGTYPFQLRIAGVPVALPFEAKDVGLSATCMECHNARTNPDNAVKGSFPHYSSMAEFLNDAGGVTYGQAVPNSPHSMMVGAAPIPNAEPAQYPETGEFMFTAPDAETGNVPGPCVTCHMWPTIQNVEDPNWHKVGSHSFNTVSPDEQFDYTAACKMCHGELKDFNFPAKADYDGNGKTEGVQDEVKGMLNVLWGALEAQGLKKVDTGYPYASLPQDASDQIENAWYNFRTVYGVMWGAESAGNEGKAQTIHNFKRAVALLQLSYKDLTGQDVPGATLIK